MAAANHTPDIQMAIDTTNHQKLRSQQQHNHHPTMDQPQTFSAGLIPPSTKHSYNKHGKQTLQSTTLPPPIVYGELSILGYNGYIPNSERSGRRNKSKFLLCKRPTPNGIKKSRHYIVKQPQATKAIQDKDLHSISYTFSRSQTIIVEYRQDETTDMFQIGRSSEDPIDFVVMDTLPAGCNANDLPSGGSSHHQSSKHSSSNHHHQQHHHHHNENASSSQQQQIAGNDLIGLNRLHRHLAKVNEEMLQYGFSPSLQDPRNRLHMHSGHNQPQAVLLNYPQPNISNLPPMMANHFRNQDSSMSHHHHHHHVVHPSGSQQQQFLSSIRSNHLSSNNNVHHEHGSSRHNNNNNSVSNSNNSNLICKRSHATQSTISRFACRILVDREPPYTARIYAAGFDSSKNIFLGEKATKWEQNNLIDGLTTNGILLMHPKQGNFYEENQAKQQTSQANSHHDDNNLKSGDIDKNDRNSCSNVEAKTNLDESEMGISSALSSHNSGNNSNHHISSSESCDKNSDNINDTNQINSFQNHQVISSSSNNNNNNDSNNNMKSLNGQFEYGGVWREVSVDGGIYAIRESRSAIQKGRRIENETNTLQDGTLIDLCGATLLWRSVDGFKASPTKRSLEEKIDMLNASRPQCPVGLNTLIIPRKPILPNSYHRSNGGGDHHHHHHRYGHHHNREHHNSYSSSSGSSSKDGGEKNSHQPYVYLKCGHVQGYHDWGATEKSNQRTCPICLSVGTVAKLSMGLEPSFYVDSGPLTHVFNPCGHMASERTVKYWCSIRIPHGTHFFHAICPFCATPLATSEPAFTKLIFQDDLD